VGGIVMWSHVYRCQQGETARDDDVCKGRHGNEAVWHRTGESYTVERSVDDEVMSGVKRERDRTPRRPVSTMCASCRSRCAPRDS
jgi:hypothetical protein